MHQKAIVSCVRPTCEKRHKKHRTALCASAQKTNPSILNNYELSEFAGNDTHSYIGFSPSIHISVQ